MGEKLTSRELKPFGVSPLFQGPSQRLQRWFDGRALAVPAIVLLSLFLNIGLYLFEGRREAIRRQYAAIDLDQRFTGPSFAPNMALPDRAEQTGLTRSSQLFGWLDKIAYTATGHAVFVGWVVDVSYIDETPVVLFFVDHAYAGSTVPGSPRPDVVKEMKLNPKWSSERIGFSVDLPASVCPASLMEAIIISRNRYAIVRNTAIKPDCSGVSR
jgi:hypothetical protein